MNDKYDKMEGYCRMLGHVLAFRYCRTMNERLPCSRILDCWFRRLPIREFIEENYSEEEKIRIFQPPKPKTPRPKSRPAKKPKVTKSPQRIRMTMDITKDAMSIVQDIRHRHRLSTGKALPLWKIVSQAIEQYGERK